MSAYACRLREENYGAISSEFPAHSAEDFRRWVTEHGGSFFIRDEDNRPFDCTLMTDLVFHQIYEFVSFNADDLFHRIKRAK